MNKLIKLLPAFALVLAATFAFAFSPAGAPEYAQDSSNPSIWYDLTGITPGPSTYECDFSEDVCTRVLPNTSATMQKEGEFVKNGNLPIH